MRVKRKSYMLKALLKKPKPKAKKPKKKTIIIESSDDDSDDDCDSEPEEEVKPVVRRPASKPIPIPQQRIDYGNFFV